MMALNRARSLGSTLNQGITRNQASCATLADQRPVARKSARVKKPRAPAALGCPLPYSSQSVTRRLL